MVDEHLRQSQTSSSTEGTLETECPGAVVAGASAGANHGDRAGVGMGDHSDRYFQSPHIHKHSQTKKSIINIHNLIKNITTYL